MEPKDNIFELRCNTFDEKKVIFKKMKGNILYPMYSSRNGEKPIIVQTPFIILKEYSLNKFSPDHFNLSHKDEELMAIEMNQIFNMFDRLDEYTKNNLSGIISLDKRINEKITYSNCVRKKTIKGKQYTVIKLKLNLKLGTDNKNTTSNATSDTTSNTTSDTTSDTTSNTKSSDTILPAIKIYYKSNYQSSQYRIHQLSDINKILYPGKRVRFILGINKLWFNNAILGYGIKIMQIEIDDTLSNKIKMLKSLKNNDMNMFDNQSYRDKYQEYIRKTINFGSTRTQKRQSNNKIIKIINESNTDKYLFTDDEEYVPHIEYEDISIAI